VRKIHSKKIKKNKTGGIKMTNNYYGNEVHGDVLKSGKLKPYALLTTEEIPDNMSGPGGTEIDRLYHFDTKEELEHALLDLGGIPLQSLEAKVTRKAQVRWKEKK